LMYSPSHQQQPSAALILPLFSRPWILIIEFPPQTEERRSLWQSTLGGKCAAPFSTGRLARRIRCGRRRSQCGVRWFAGSGPPSILPQAMVTRVDSKYRNEMTTPCDIAISRQLK
jgi:hypothetical protein